LAWQLDIDNISKKIHEKVEFISDPEVEGLELKSAEDMAQLIALFHGQAFERNSFKDQELMKLIDKAITHIQKDNLGYEQFNEILLLLGEDRVERPFFEFFFLMSGDKKPLKRIGKEKIKKGIIKFRGYAMLLCGNFKYAFKIWSKLKTWQELLKELAPHCVLWEAEKRKAKRCKPALETKAIPRNRTRFTGYLMKKELDHDLATLAALGSQIYGDQFVKDLNLDQAQRNLMNEIVAKSGVNTKEWEGKIDLVSEQIRKLRDEFYATRKVAKANTLTYLTWDYIDVYFATSMREAWEFFSTFDFIKEVKPTLRKMGLRYFDPTQSFTEERLDKGLVEGLMLKRAKCTVYFVQEADTLGKDAELAATLAQGKPVIAYVPKFPHRVLIKRIQEYPLKYLWKRTLVLKAEDVFIDNRFLVDVDNFGLGEEGLRTFENAFFPELERFLYHGRTFNFIESEEELFKEKFHNGYKDACKLLALAENRYWERRAETLKRKHPLGLQVDLSSGVANGVLVVRSASDCIRLISQFFKGGLKFRIENKEYVRQLVENSTDSTFRVVTNNRCLTNAFWNFYF